MSGPLQPAQGGRPTALRLDGVVVEAGGRVLLEVPRLAVAEGERVAVVGPNGAGKSTLLRLVAGLATPARGRVEVLGRRFGADAAMPSRREAARWRARVGLLMQGLHPVPRLSARDNALAGALARLRGAQRWASLWRQFPTPLVAEAEAALARLGLAGQAGQRADRLSGGERQKLALARLLLQQPRLWLADEPTSALDPQATLQVCEILREAAAEPGRTMIVVVHDLELLPRLAQRVIGIAGGRVVCDAPLHQVSPAELAALYAAPAPRDGATSPQRPGGAPVTGETGMVAGRSA